ncbi:MAG: UbiX family flavin prenyltransferase [Planctomycetota bacterium]|jgi:4-hydroxy-3-polyprenylbenzoate decarboxylase
MQTDPPNRIVVGISGASGAAYAVRTMELAAEADVEIHLAVSTLGRRLLFDELGLKRLDPDALTNGRGALVTVHNDNDHGAAIASGSFLHRGMVVVPCSSNTLAAVATGITDNLLQRAAAVTLKERRRLIIAHRESPLGHIDILNMKRLSDAGAIVAPLAPGFYLLPRTVGDLVDFMAGKLLDLLAIPHDLDTRWEERLEQPEPRGDAR